MRVPAEIAAVIVAVVGAALLAAGCSTGGPRADQPARGTVSPSVGTSGPLSSAPSPSPSAPTPTASADTASPGPRPGVAGRPARPADLRVRTAVATVRHLAGTIGPRHGTSAAFGRAVDWVARRLEAFGYDVTRQTFRVPAGVSWGVPVEAGRSSNVIASDGPVDLRRPHLVVGAHLDTVPQAPGAEDNASGVGALLAVAEAVVGRPTRLPVVFVAFGAEEPRGAGDDDHHYGSRELVRRLDAPERAAMRGMVSLDRVGVGTVLPVCSAGDGATALRSQLLRAAARAGVTARACAANRASDHWSFVRAGMPGVRLGSTPYAAYHSPDDRPAVVNAAQVRRAAATVVSWLGRRSGPAERSP